MTTGLKLNVKFKDATIPQHALDLLAQKATDIIFHHFSAKLLQSEGTDPKYPEEELQLRTVALAKDAFDRHRASPYPGDEVQKVFAEIDVFAEKSLAADFGLTAIRNLHPMVSFTQG